MPGFDGSGNYVRAHNWTADAANGVDINAGEMDAEDNAIAGAFNNAVTRDGQGKMTADFTPATDNAYNLGTGVKRWLTLNGVPTPTTQQNLGKLLYRQTAAESAVSVTPVNYWYPPFNVMRYGAVGDGVTDDSGAINKAVTVATQNGGAEITYPPLTFIVSTSINDVANVTHSGQGIFATTVQATGNFPVFQRQGGSASVSTSAGGIKQMSIWAGWRASAPTSNPLAYGISWTAAASASSSRPSPHRPTASATPSSVNTWCRYGNWVWAPPARSSITPSTR
jgi:Pectate lyase superfamily protein